MRRAARRIAPIALTIAAMGGPMFAPPMASAHQAAPSEAEVSDAELQALVAVIVRGQALYRYDQAAWHTTDTMIVDTPRDLAQQVRGWVVVPAENRGLRAIYYGGAAGAHFAIYSTLWTGGTNVSERRVLRTADESRIGGEAARLIALRDAVDASQLTNCSTTRPFNTVILPASETGDVDSVYFMTPQTDANAIPMGGHHRIDFSSGREVARRSFTRGCIDILKDATTSGVSISHILDPIPTEIHLFSAYATGLPIYVGTEDAQHGERIWVMEILDGQPRVYLLPPEPAAPSDS